ncbi:Lactation elevated protein 1 [Hordeum vulgare]|nr:Lactation elevated protein 1 [Hordeum vulgare]
MLFNNIASTASEVFDEMVGSNDVYTEFVNLLVSNTVDIDQALMGDFNYNEIDGGVDGHGGEEEVEEIDEEVYDQVQAKKCEKWELIEKEFPSNRGSLKNMDDNADDDVPQNLNKHDRDKKTKEKIKREHEASSLRDKIDAMVQTNELMLAKTLEAKKELADKKA